MEVTSASHRLQETVCLSRYSRGQKTERSRQPRKKQTPKPTKSKSPQCELLRDDASSSVVVQSAPWTAPPPHLRTKRSTARRPGRTHGDRCGIGESEARDLPKERTKDSFFKTGAVAELVSTSKICFFIHELRRGSSPEGSFGLTSG